MQIECSSFCFFCLFSWWFLLWQYSNLDKTHNAADLFFNEIYYLNQWNPITCKTHFNKEEMYMEVNLLRNCVWPTGDYFLG